MLARPVVKVPVDPFGNLLSNSRSSCGCRRLAHENDYRASSLDDERPAASTSYASTAGQLLYSVQTAATDAIGGVSSAVRRASNVKHRQRAGREGDSLLAHDDDFEDGAVLSKADTRKGGQASVLAVESAHV